MSDSALPDYSYLRGIFRKPFAEQVAALRIRLGNQVGTAAWDDLWQAQHDRAFVVAGAQKADLLADLAAAVDKAITQGTTLEEFRRDFRRIVEERGWHGWTGEDTEKGQAWRTKVIYQTNMRTSYMAGRFAQLTRGNFAFWVYFHGGSREPRLNHLSWNGIALPPDHPFWVQHYPPNGWGCSCRVFGARDVEGVRRLGGDPDKVLPAGWDVIDPRTGTLPGIGKGWGYAPGASVAEDITRFAETKQSQLPPTLGAEFRQAASRISDQPEAVGDVLRLINQIADDDLSDELRQQIALRPDPVLGTADRIAILAYSRNEIYQTVNRDLLAYARGDEGHATVRAFAGYLDRALAVLPRFQGTAYRGVRAPSAHLLEFLSWAEPGEVLALNGFTSTSHDPERAFGGVIRFVITSLSGRKIEHLAQDPAEREVLFPRGLQFVIRKIISDGNGGMIVHMDELTPAEWRRLPLEAMNAELLG